MKRQEDRETIQVHQGVYSSPIYELELWRKCLNYEYTADDYKEELENTGELSCHMICRGVGLYPTQKRALEAMNMMYYDSTEGQEPIAMFIRQRPLCCLLQRTEYIKEWSYRNGLLVDESIVRNYDEDYYKFHGRPESMVFHKVGDIVQYFNGDGWYWGIIDAVPPTIEYIKEVNDRITAKTGKPSYKYSIMHWIDDSYRIIISNEANASTCVLAHHVFAPFEPIPDYVREVLTEGYRKTNG